MRGVGKAEIGLEGMFTPELGDQIVRAYRSGVPLTTIARGLGFKEATVWGWTKDYPSFGSELTRARPDHAAALADQVVDIADNDTDAARARNRFTARQWACKVYDRATFGDQAQIQVSGQVSIVDAMERASARLLPMCDPAMAGNGQVIDITPETAPSAAVVQSAAAADDDIFG